MNHQMACASLLFDVENERQMFLTFGVYTAFDRFVFLLKQQSDLIISLIPKTFFD